MGHSIASTAAAYADAALSGVVLEGRRRPVWDADALTVNPYLGRDAVEPFLQSARRPGVGTAPDKRPVARTSAASRSQCYPGGVGAARGADPQLGVGIQEEIALLPGGGRLGLGRGNQPELSRSSKPSDPSAPCRTRQAIRDCSDHSSMKPGDAAWEKSPPDSAKVASCGS